MIDLYVDSTNNIFGLEHDMHCKEHIVDEFVKALDVIIADYEIKTIPSIDELSEEEKQHLIVLKRAEYLNLMKKQDCTCTDYLRSKITHIKEDNPKIDVNIYVNKDPILLETYCPYINKNE